MAHEGVVIQYFRNKSRRPVGMFVAKALTDKTYNIGYSKCKVSMDSFDVEKGIDLAVKRCNARKPLDIPSSMQEELAHFKARVAKYFKDKTLAVA